MKKVRLYVGIAFLFTLIPLLAQAQSESYQGERLYELKCGRCHMAYAPQKFSAEQWETVMKEMGPLSELNEKTEKSIMGYLEENAGEKKIGGLSTAPLWRIYLCRVFFLQSIHGYLRYPLSECQPDRQAARADFL